MKLLHLANGNLYGGIERFLVTLARLEQAEPSKKFVSSFILSHEGRLATELREGGARVTVLPGVRVRNPWAIRRARAVVRAELDRERPDLVLAHGPWAYFVFGHALTSPQPPLVFWQHGPASRDVFHWLAGWRRPAAVLANSAYTAQSAGAIFPEIHPRVLRLLVAEMKQTRPRESIREELGAEGQVVIVQTSRFEPWKGHQLLLDALLRLKALRWQLWLAGGQTRPSEKRLRTALETQAREAGVLDRLRFLGERRDIADVLSAADIFCQPNVGQEPYGLGVLEAMACGLPLVVTEPGATAIGPSGPWGEAVPPSADTLSSYLSKLIGDRALRERLAKGSRAYHCRELASVEVLAEMHREFEAIASRGS
jgi:glycosyltransferase involved in cell wall biosynthesis